MNSSLSPRSAILMYHRVADEPTDPWSLCVSLQHFREHLEVLTQTCETMQFRKLTRLVASDGLKAISAVLTFDDGYADNLYNALPLLQEYGIRATAFLVTSCLEKSIEFWSDELESLILRPGNLPSTLEFELDGCLLRWELEDASVYDETTFERFRMWKAWEAPPTTRHSFYYDVWKTLRPFQDDLRVKAMEQIRAWAKRDRPVSTLRRTLTGEEVRTLSGCDLVEIGSHTETHPQLSSIPPDHQRIEIQKSKMALEEFLGHEVESFAYPYGFHGDYTSESVQLVKDAGFTGACTTIPGVARNHSDSFQMPRLQVHDWSGDQFRKHLSEWFHSETQSNQN